MQTEMEQKPEERVKAGASGERLTEVSVVVPVTERYDDLEGLYSSHAEELRKITDRYEFIFIIDGHMDMAYREIRRFSRNHPEIKVIKFARTLGEAMALSSGFEKARGRYIFTLASYSQVEPEEIKKLYHSLAADECDIVVSRRKREGDSFFNRVQSLIFHKFLHLLTGSNYRDISCGLRGLKTDKIGVFDIYGDLHRFIPILAEHHGLRVKEVDVRQKKEDTKLRVYRLRTYLNRIIDVVTLFFLLRFTYKPFRFFGLIGSALIIAGMGVISYLVYLRLFTDGFGLRDKPSLFLASLLMVIGIQILAIGLIGEIIIYTHSKRLKRFNIKERLE